MARRPAKLFIYIFSTGYAATGGDLLSKPEYKVHRANSVHYDRLAIDLNLFKDGVFLDKSTHHLKFGQYWESLHELCRWGGNWDKDSNPFKFGENDGNHYSLTHEGRA